MSPSTAEIAAILATIAPELATVEIDPNADLVNELDIDSMDFLDFLAALAARYGVDIPEADYSKMATLSACAAYLGSKTA